MDDLPEAPAGWYPDHLRPGTQRYWNGRNWDDSPSTTPIPMEIGTGSLGTDRPRGGILTLLLWGLTLTMMFVLMLQGWGGLVTAGVLGAVACIISFAHRSHQQRAVGLVPLVLLLSVLFVAVGTGGGLSGGPTVNPALVAEAASQEPANMPVEPSVVSTAPTVISEQTPAPVDEPEVSTPGLNEPTWTEEPVESSAPVQTDVYYQNCSAVRAAGAAPLTTSDPGYSTKLDRDRDGIACE